MDFWAEKNKTKSIGNSVATFGGRRGLSLSIAARRSFGSSPNSSWMDLEEEEEKVLNVLDEEEEEEDGSMPRRPSTRSVLTNPHRCHISRTNETRQWHLASDPRDDYSKREMGIKFRYIDPAAVRQQ